MLGGFRNTTTKCQESSGIFVGILSLLWICQVVIAENFHYFCCQESLLGSSSQELLAAETLNFGHLKWEEVWKHWVCLSFAYSFFTFYFTVYQKCWSLQFFTKLKSNSSMLFSYRWARKKSYYNACIYFISLLKAMNLKITFKQQNLSWNSYLCIDVF